MKRIGCEGATKKSHRFRSTLDRTISVINLHCNSLINSVCHSITQSSPLSLPFLIGILKCEIEIFFPVSS